MKRRSLLLGLGAALAAPAVVKAENLMRVASLRQSLVFNDTVIVPPGVYSGKVIGVALTGGGPGELITVALDMGFQVTLNNESGRRLPES